jgi:GT2 family glycosyltransferase
VPEGTRVVWDVRSRLHPADAGGCFATGGSPWRLARLSPSAEPFVRRLRAAGPAGSVPDGRVERAVAALLVERGLAHPLAQRAPVATGQVTVVVPAHDRVALLERCLAALSRCGVPVVVVDDASVDADAVAAAAARHGARVLRQRVNRGPAAARNRGLAETSTPFVAFVDSDVEVPPDWLDALLPLFEDPRVAAVAPRVRPRAIENSVRPRAIENSVRPRAIENSVRPRAVDSGDEQGSLLARHEEARSALDMGRRRELVRPGAALGFLPSAALVVRREALGAPGEAGFDEALRLGEDVDLVWRLAAAGWHVRYEPSVEVRHAARTDAREWLVRRYEYGTSAADLDRRHPGLLAPARVSGWNAAATALLLARRPGAAGVVTAGAVAALAHRLREVQAPPRLAALVVGKGLLADAAAAGHALRREWWPVGWLALAAAPRSRLARAGAAAMLVPVVLEWVRQRPQVDPARYAALRLVEDAAYGSGVLRSSLRDRRWAALRPEVRLPSRPWSGRVSRGS